MKKMKENRAGHYIPVKFAEEIENYLHSRDDVSLDFIYGACASLGFLTCKKDDSMYGTDHEEYFNNAVSWLNDEMLQEEAFGKAQEVIKQLEAMGVEVIGVDLVRSDD